MNTIAIITARKNSRGLKDKNIRDLCGKPVIEYSIDYAFSASILDGVYVTSDSERALEIARRCAAIPIARPPELAQDDTRIDFVLKHAVEHLEKGGVSAEIIVLLYACVPIREPNLIERGIKLLRDGGGDSVKSYAPVPSRYHSMYHLGQRPLEYLRQNLKPQWFHDGSIVILKREWILEPLPLNDFGYLGRKCLPLFITDECVNIDSEKDFEKAEEVLSESRTN